jgi:peroxiredoxin
MSNSAREKSQHDSGLRGTKPAKMRLFTTTLASCLLSFVIQAQKPDAAKLNEKSVVRDSAGTIYPYAIWKQLLTTGRYIIKTGNPDFILVRLTDEQYDKKVTTSSKPPESSYFKTGTKLSHFKTSDINGEKIGTKGLGKILVLHFWSMGSGSAISEIPALDELAKSFQADSSVVFISIAPDKKEALREFLKTRSFSYRVIDNGSFIAEQCGVKLFPTHVVVSTEGTVYFHTTGVNVSTSHWIRKSIEELKTQPLAGLEKKNIP